MRSGIVAGVLASALAAGIAGAAGSASADPSYPSDHDVADAREAEAEANGSVAAIEARMAALTSQADDLYIQVAKAVEAYNGARIQLDEAERGEEQAREHAARSAAAAEQARIELGRLAAASYGQGGELSTVGMLLTADDGEALYDGLGVLRSVTESRAGVYERSAQAMRDAEQAVAAAKEALAERTAAADEARAAREAAEASVAEQERALAVVEAEREVALAELAAARGTTAELERRRQEAIEERESAEREERERESQSPADVTPDEPRPDDETALDEPPRPSEPPVTPDVTPTPTAMPRPSPTPTAPPEPPKPPVVGAQAAIDYARAQLGKAYEWGADGPSTFDCSGLTMRAWEAGGLALPHWSVAQARQVTRVSYAELRPGDLIFWSDNGLASGVYHVGLFIGGGQMIHAPRPGKTVEVQSVFYWVDPAFYGRVG